MARTKSLSKQFQITLEGDFFTRDPSKTFGGNVRDMMDAIAAEAGKSVRAQIVSRAGSMPSYTGWTAATVRGRTRSLTGKRWLVSAVISADTSGMSRKDAIRTKAAGASIEARWHPFRKTASAIRRSRAVLSANLTKGL